MVLMSQNEEYTQIVDKNSSIDATISDHNIVKKKRIECDIKKNKILRLPLIPIIHRTWVNCIYYCITL